MNVETCEHHDPAGRYIAHGSQMGRGLSRRYGSRVGRGLSRWCRGGVAAVALVSFSVKPATVTKVLAGGGGYARATGICWQSSRSGFGNPTSRVLHGA